jgi:excisionase family DNA binding protein
LFIVSYSHIVSQVRRKQIVTINNITDREAVTRREFARALRVSESLVRKWQRDGKIRVIRLGRCIRVPIEELIRVARGGVR